MNSDTPYFSGYPDVAAYMGMLNASNPQKLFSPIGITTIFIAILAGAILLKGTIPLIVAFPAIITTALLMGFFGWLGIYLRKNGSRKAYQKAIATEPRTGWIDADGIHIQIQGGRTDLQWDYFTHYFTTCGALGLFKDKNLVDCFDASMFSQTKQWFMAQQMIQARMKSLQQSGPGYPPQGVGSPDP